MQSLKHGACDPISKVQTILLGFSLPWRCSKMGIELLKIGVLLPTLGPASSPGAICLASKGRPALCGAVRLGGQGGGDFAARQVGLRAAPGGGGAVRARVKRGIRTEGRVADGAQWRALLRK